MTLEEQILRIAEEEYAVGAANAQAPCVLWRVKVELGEDMDLAKEREILDIWYRLFRDGRLCWGYDLQNSSWPFFHVPVRALPVRDQVESPIKIPTTWTRAPWNLEEALLLIRHLQPDVWKAGYWLALAGSVLIQGVSGNDVDIVAIPRTDTTEQDLQSLGRAVTETGFLRKKARTVAGHRVETYIRRAGNEQVYKQLNLTIVTITLD